MNCIDEFRRYVKVTRLDEIARRYFVMNAFDGALTMLGILVGAYISGSQDVKVILSAGLGASIAMGMSGFAGAYMTEKAERIKKLKELEDAMLLDLDDTVYGKASRFASVFTALVDGLSPALAALLILSPFLLIKYGVIDYSRAYFLSTAVSGVTLFALGGYLARISNESILKYGIQMVAVGFLTAVVVFVVGAHSV